VNPNDNASNSDDIPQIKKLCRLIEKLDMHWNTLTCYSEEYQEGSDSEGDDTQEDAGYTESPLPKKVYNIINWFARDFYTELQNLEMVLRNDDLREAVCAVKEEFSSSDCPLMGILDGYYYCLIEKGENGLSPTERNYRFQASMIIRNLVNKLEVARRICATLPEETRSPKKRGGSASRRNAS